MFLLLVLVGKVLCIGKNPVFDSSLKKVNGLALPLIVVLDGDARCYDVHNVTMIAISSDIAIRRESTQPSLADRPGAVHTSSMTLKTAALLALLGMVLLTVLTAADFMT